MPAALVELVADAVGSQSIMLKMQNAFGLLPEQDIDQMMSAKALARAVDRGERLFRRDRSIPARHRRTAVVAIPARRMVRLAEITEQDLASAGNRFAIADQGLGLLPL